MDLGFVEIQIEGLVDSGELMGLLAEFGPLGAWEDGERLHLYWRKEVWSPELLQAVTAALQQLGTNIGSGDIKTAFVADQDWNLRWTETIRPIRLGRNILVRQSWNPGDSSFKGIELIIDPKRAFGSGYHATTRLLVEWLEDLIRGGERVFDVGTGSGILSMVALRLGARVALGIDNDPVAIECARENAINNGFGPELELRVATLDEVGGEFDLITANLDRNTLLRYGGSLLSHLTPDGSALLSGLQAEDYDDILPFFRGLGGRVCDLRRCEEWIAVELRL